ncbi:MAG: amidohydrolase [Gammaproteobacteria bacterium]|nr:amidohydrolase [Gammaproteobacteria bacterium]
MPVHSWIKKSLSFAVLAITCLGARADASDIASLKASVVDSVERQSATMAAMSDAIWAHAEIALNETKSSEVLAGYAEKQGFRVQRGVAGMPTAFIATYGEGEPVIGILGEFDALPRLSQQASTERHPVIEGGNGHGCGHNLFGVASLAAATAIKQRIEAGELSGTIRFYGTPAEEAIGGKIYMAREGLFDDVDVVLSWHPSSETKVDTAGSQAMVETIVEFRGVSAHAANDPWNGRSALDGLELFTHALNLWREHVRPTVRIHYAYVDGGGAPNVVPATASAALWIRDNEMPSVLELYERMQEMAQGAATAANVDVEVRLISGTYNLLQNRELAKIVQANLQALGPIEFTPAENEFAKKLQAALGVPAVGLNGNTQPLDLDADEVDGGSTDTADVSWLVPTLEFGVATAPTDIPWHSWGVVASSGMSIGHRGMTHASKTLAASLVDLFTSPQKIAAAKSALREDLAGLSYHPYIPDGPPPIPAER